ncbi:MAG: glycosyltransferase family 9 protein [Bacteroidetes bacterium]|nr:glycosyltransferase family 9 protein [Bacteroidota bacterium]
MKQFLVIQTAFLGDAVLVTSLLEKLHAFFPDAAIDLVVRKGNDGLFEGHPFLRKLHVWDKRKGKTRALFRLIGELRKTRYDHILNAQRFFSTGLLTVLARGREKVGYDKNPLSFLFTRTVEHRIPDPARLRKDGPPSGAITHEVDRLNALIAHLTDASRPLPRLHPAASHRAEVDRLTGGPPDRRIITIAPASVWHTKQWPAEKWVALIGTLPPDRRVLLTGGPGDTALCERIAREAGRGEVVAGKLSLLGTAVLMQGAAMNYVNDSAPLHIASAMGAPVTAVFCSTVPAFGFGPLNANGRVVQLEEPLYCRPCGLHGYKACPEGHFKCASGIEVASVVP